MSIDSGGQIATIIDADGGLERTYAVGLARRNARAVVNNIENTNNAEGFASRPGHFERAYEHMEAS